MRSAARSIFALATIVLSVGAPVAHAGAPATRPSESSAQDETRWDVADHGFSVRAASTFVQRPTTQPHIVLMLRDSANTDRQKMATLLMVTVIPLRNPQHPPTLDAEVASFKGAITARHPEAKFDDASDMTLDGAEAKMLSFTQTITQKHTKELRAFAIHDAKLYTVSFTCDAADAGSLKKHFDVAVVSFRWSKR